MKKMESAVAIPKPGRESPESEQLSIDQRSPDSEQRSDDERFISLGMALAQALQKLAANREK